MRHLNYHHLLYFWTVAREGGVARAAQALHVTPQTISGQIKMLEDAVGARLFARKGRRLVLTDTGQVVYEYAEEIFALGAELSEVLRGGARTGPLTLTVGITDVMPKLVAYRLLEPALAMRTPVRMVCREGKLDALMADLAMHQLDIVLADGPAAPGLNVRVYSHLLGDSGVTFFAASSLAQRLAPGFPRSLDGEPMLLPTRESALRRALELWFDAKDIRPVAVGEFDDSALIKAFGQAGTGVFASPSVIDPEITSQYGVEVVGRSEDVRERFYAISGERRIKHPAVVEISEAARRDLFGATDVDTDSAPPSRPARPARPGAESARRSRV
ncbi:MAG: transcriptional activator NhaR [Ectothiorhodospiraceae bacterium]|nr:transcriptional activator NhaR [Ectothiorhodospiraceae bacterium]